MYAICVPSGDQAGQVSWASVVVSRVLFDPSASMTQMSQFESSLWPQRVYAIFAPSALQSGMSSFFVSVCVSRTVLVELGSTTKMSNWLCFSRLNAMSPFVPGNAARAKGSEGNEAAAIRVVARAIFAACLTATSVESDPASYSDARPRARRCTQEARRGSTLGRRPRREDGVGVEDIERARAAIASTAWAGAYAGFRAADLSELTARDLEGFADAAWWLSKLDESLDLRHKAYAAYVTAGDERAAAAVAARLAIEHFMREEASVGAGFLMRAQRHAEGIANEPETGWLALLEATVARFTGDFERAVELSERAIELGRRHGVSDLVAMAIHSQGLALIATGRVPEGFALLDEAMAAVVAGDLSPYFTGVIYCAVISACLELGDVRRAGEWSEAAVVWCDTLAPGSPFPAWCRVDRAEVARLRGSWAEAESEAMLAADELALQRPGLAASAFVQLGEVRRRVGDLAGAEAAFERAQELGQEPQPGLALVRVSQGNADAARSALRVALSGALHPPVRARLLAAQVEAALAAGAIDEARTAADELRAMAEALALPAFAAASETAAGSLALAEGDVPAALDALRRATATWQDLRLPYETARARTLLGQALLAGGDEDGARRELRGALAEFERLGAAGDVAEVREAMEGRRSLPAGLTAREAEVLRLVAAGKTNRDIAVELVISEHTVARHLQNMFAKLGVSSRAAATAFAFEHRLA